MHKFFGNGIKQFGLLVFLLLLTFSCKESTTNNPNGTIQELTIFTINDVHGQLENFAKVKHIVDIEKVSKNVVFVCAGDNFSGNPVVDSHEEKGFPLIDIMNQAGVDVSVLGNHEYDYGEAVLKDRMDQAEFEFICANVDMTNSTIPQPKAYQTVTVGDIKLSFLGLVETNGSRSETIPSTHPWRVKNFKFSRPESVIEQYKDLKATEGADLYIALTHIGHDGGDYVLGDYQIAESFPYFDLIIGGHSHREIDTLINEIPIYQTGSYLHNLGKIELKIKQGEIVDLKYTLIDLDSYEFADEELVTLIQTYNDQPALIEVIGYAHADHSILEVACFYTTALHEIMQVDLSFQNTGGVRAGLDMGDITKREIYEIAPFNNRTVIYSMTASEVKSFLKGSGAGFYYSGIEISQAGTDIVLSDLTGNAISDNKNLKVGINDYIPAVHSSFFPTDGEIQSLTAAETLIAYLEEVNHEVNFSGCSSYFRFQE